MAPFQPTTQKLLRPKTTPLSRCVIPEERAFQAMPSGDVRIVPPAPTVGVLPVPFLLLVGGLLVGWLLAGLARWPARVGARRRGAVMEARLRASITTVADEEILAPVQRVLDRHAATREALRHAADV